MCQKGLGQEQAAAAARKQRKVNAGIQYSAPGPQPVGWCQPHSGWVSLLQLTPFGNTITNTPRCVSPRWFQIQSRWGASCLFFLSNCSGYSLQHDELEMWERHCGCSEGSVFVEDNTSCRTQRWPLLALASIPSLLYGLKICACMSVRTHVHVAGGVCMCAWKTLVNVTHLLYIWEVFTCVSMRGQCICMPWPSCGRQRTSWGRDSLLPPHRFQSSDSNHQLCQKAALPTQASHQLKISELIFSRHWPLHFIGFTFYLCIYAFVYVFMASCRSGWP